MNDDKIFSLRRRRRIATLATLILCAISAFATNGVEATTTAPTKVKSPGVAVKPGSDRLRPDLTKIPIETLIRRAAKARGTLKITGSMTFVSKAIVSGQYLFGGAIDFDRGQSDLDMVEVFREY